MNIKSGKLSPRPFARLLSMLGEQLIKDNSVALIELAKNAYDADSDWVQIRIGNMANYGKKGLPNKDKPFIEIEDSGDGMSFDIISNVWMNPASPNKFFMKKNKRGTTAKGRVIQGEKGIGRYAIFQIGKKVTLYTRERLSNNAGGDEISLTTDLTKFTDEIVTTVKDSNFDEPLYLDQISSKYTIRDEPIFIERGKIKIEGREFDKEDHGTLIHITDLNYEWTYNDVLTIRRKLSDLQSPFGKIDFDVSIIWDGDEIYDPGTGIYFEDIRDNASLEIVGAVDKKGLCNYTLNDKKGEIDLIDNLRKDKVKENVHHFFSNEYQRTHDPQCGPFEFKYFVFDLRKITNPKVKEYIRNHRIYIYRDDIRVYPYGDSDNDWMKLDIYRGTLKSGYYLSNDQVIGFIDISTNENPLLRDKTNREGLLEQGTVYEDLRLLNLSIVNYLNIEFRKKDISEIPESGQPRLGKLHIQADVVKKQINSLVNYFKKIGDLKGINLLQKLSKAYEKELKIYMQQINLVEDLAGVGIAVDMASHDVMVVLNRAVENIQIIQSIIDKKDFDIQTLSNKFDMLSEQILFINELLQGIQPIFRSARRKTKNNRIADIINKVKRYYKNPLEKHKIRVKIIEKEAPYILKQSSEGVLLQLFINLIDNSLYWLVRHEVKNPEIRVLIDSSSGTVIFADNGPGIKSADVDYIFEPFFSTKGLEARGLGLYIARQLTDTYNYDFYYLTNRREKLLSGANFKLEFGKK